jgi:hypothetical protein
MINHIVSYLEGEKILGDAFRARALASWHTSFFSMVDQTEKGGMEYGVHPADGTVGLIQHLTQHLTVFQLNDPNTSGETLIPMVMVHRWQKQLPSGEQFPQFLEEVYAVPGTCLFYAILIRGHNRYNYPVPDGHGGMEER